MCSLQIKFASNIFYAPHFWLSDIFKGYRNEALAWFELKYCVVTGIIKTDSFQEKLVLYGSGPPNVFLGIGILRKRSKFTGEHPRRSVISIKFQSNFIEITLMHGYSPVNWLHILRTPFSFFRPIRKAFQYNRNNFLLDWYLYFSAKQYSNARFKIIATKNSNETVWERNLQNRNFKLSSTPSKRGSYQIGKVRNCYPYSTANLHKCSSIFPFYLKITESNVLFLNSF